MKRQCFTRARNRKECQSGGVEDQYRAAQPVDDSIPIERNQPGKDRDSDVSPVADGRGWNRPDHQIARDPTGIARGERQNQHPEEIEPVLDPGGSAAQRENEGATKIESNQQRI